MSINFTSDIDGATSGSGITKITVDGKTINLSEVGGNAGNGVVSGTFTPEAQGTSISIDTGIDFTHIFVGKKTATLSYGYRTFVGMFVDIGNDFIYVIGTNAAGTSASGIISNWAESVIFPSPGLTKNGTVLEVALATTTSCGVLCPEEYIWYAW